MSKIVTIPTDGGNPFVVILGGVKYVYKPGETVEVPDGVALEIEEWERWHKKYYGENEPPFGAGGGNANEVVIRCNGWLEDELTDSNPNYDAFSYDADAIVNAAQALLSHQVVSAVVLDGESNIECNCFCAYRCYAYIEGNDITFEIMLQYGDITYLAMTFLNGVLIGHMWESRN